jgi:predicted transcriptional regulator
MTKPAVFTMKLEPDLRAAFMAEAEAAHQPASQVVRQLMREFVQQQRDRREHTAFLQRKVDAARASILAGQGVPNDAVAADFAARRERIVAQS